MQNVVNRSKATRTFKVKVGDALTKVELRIGANDLDNAVVDALTQDANFRVCQHRGIFRIEPTPAVADEVEYEEGDTVVLLRLLKVVEAKKAVAACTDLEQLKVWLEQDGRKTVREAILARGIELTDKAPKAADSEADGDRDDSGAPDYPIFGGE